MANKKYIVKLTRDEREALRQVIRRGKSAGWKIKRAQVLLKCDQGDSGAGWTDPRIAEAYDVGTRSIESWRKRAVEEGPLAVLQRKKRTVKPEQLILDGEGEAQLTKLACSAPPDGAGRWTLRLLAERLVELEIVDAISHETVRRTLKKTI